MVGTTVSHYKIVKKLGEGGMGVVYQAEDQKLARTVALKFLPHTLTRDQHAKERFIREARSASALEHVNICSVYDLAETEEGDLYMVMPAYDGATLAEMIARGPLTVERAAELALQIATGLAEAHRHGIIHRDVNPSNIFVTSGGVVKILDFGLAVLSGSARMTEAGRTAGTLAYMPPEAVAGEDLDVRADIWALGVTLYEMLTGRLPFRGEHAAAMMYSITSEDPLDLATQRVGVPASLGEVCMRCLRKERSARPQSMEELIAMLRGALGSEGGLRHPGIRKAAGVVVIVGLVTLGWYLTTRDHRSAGPAGRARVAVLPFSSPGNDSGLTGLVRHGQALLAAEFIGVDWLGVVDPLSLNGYLESSMGSINLDRGTELFSAVRRRSVDYLIDPSASRVGSGFRLQTNVIDLSGDPSELAFAFTDTSVGEGEIDSAISKAASRVLDFLEVRVLHENQDRDMRPWLTHRRSSTAALKAFSQAWECMYKADYEEAGRYLNLAIQLDSMFVSPRVWRIPGLVRQGRLAEAEREYRFLKGIELEVSPFERTMIALAGANIRKDYARQAACLEEALQYSPENNIVLGNLAYFRYRMSDYEGALQALAPCLESRWRYPPMYPLAGTCYIKVGRLKEAQKVLEQSLSMPHVDPRTFALLAALSLNSGDSVSTARYVEQCQDLFHRRRESAATAAMILGEQFSLLGRFDRAVEWFQRAVRDSPEVGGYREKLGEALYRAGRKEEAQRECERALRLDPHRALSHLLEAELYEEKGDTSSALAHYQSCVEADSALADSARVLKRIQALQR